MKILLTYILFVFNCFSFVSWETNIVKSGWRFCFFKVRI